MALITLMLPIYSYFFLKMFKRDADQLENWLQSREAMLHDPKLGDSILQVEELIRKHEDFEKTIEAQEEKFAALRRVTLVKIIIIFTFCYDSFIYIVYFQSYKSIVTDFIIDNIFSYISHILWSLFSNVGLINHCVKISAGGSI